MASFCNTYNLLDDEDISRALGFTWDTLPVERNLSDGMYDVIDDIETLFVFAFTPIGNKIEATKEEIIEFINKYPQCVIASSYETNVVILLSRAPKRIPLNYAGSGFNYGSTNLIENAPRRLLILAEND